MIELGGFANIAVGDLNQDLTAGTTTLTNSVV